MMFSLSDRDLSASRSKKNMVKKTMIQAKKECLVSIPCISNVRMIRKHDRLVIGDGPDALACRLLAAVTVDCNWPSQWHSKFPDGYIGLVKDAGGFLRASTYLYYDIATGKIAQAAVFFFRLSAVETLWKRDHVRQEISRSLAAAPWDEVLQRLGPTIGHMDISDRERGCRSILVNSAALSLSELEHLLGALGSANVAA